MKKELQPCGTRAAYRRHRSNGEVPCAECVSANNEDSLRRYYENPSVRKKSSSEWYKKNTEKRKMSNKIWASKNKDKKNIYDLRARHRRRARKIQNGFEFYTEQQVFDLYGLTCHICLDPIDLSLPRKTGNPGWELGLHIDHLVPISKGGEDSLSNVRPSHAACNLKKHAKPLSK